MPVTSVMNVKVRLKFGFPKYISENGWFPDAEKANREIVGMGRKEAFV